MKIENVLSIKHTMDPIVLTSKEGKKVEFDRDLIAKKGLKFGSMKLDCSYEVLSLVVDYILKESELPYKRVTLTGKEKIEDYLDPSDLKMLHTAYEIDKGLVDFSKIVDKLKLTTLIDKIGQYLAFKIGADGLDCELLIKNFGKMLNATELTVLEEAKADTKAEEEPELGEVDSESEADEEAPEIQEESD